MAEGTEAVLELLSGKASVDQLARRFGVRAATVEGWREQALEGIGESLRQGTGKSSREGGAAAGKAAAAGSSIETPMVRIMAVNSAASLRIHED